MALFGKKNKDETAPKESAAKRLADKRAAKRKEKKTEFKKKKKKGFLDSIGVKTEVEPTEEEIVNASRQKQLADVWLYLREMIDKGCEEYFRDGTTETLRSVVRRPALDSMITHLDELKRQGITWTQPNRTTRTDYKIEIISDKPLNSKGNKSSSFTIQEKFLDNSVYQTADGKQRISDGTQQIIQATVEVQGEYNYQLVSVVRVPDPVE